MKLYLSDAVEFVRARMDELSFSNDDMISPAEDDRNFDNTVEKLLPEAAVFIYRAAPASLLEPQGEIDAGSDEIASVTFGTDGSIGVTIDLSYGFLRMVSFKANDSDIYVTETAPFDGPKARMQTNPYTRGTYDEPVVVERKTANMIHFTYYSIRDKDAERGFVIQKIDKPSYEEEDGDKSIFCPDFLSTATLNRLVGMVLDTYRENQLAQLFYQKANSFIQ